MSSSKKLLQSASGFIDQSGGDLFVEDVFSIDTYKGTSSSGNQIVNGIDLANEGGMVWLKNRDTTNGGLMDTERGVGKIHYTYNTYATDTEASGYGLSSFNNNGFTLGQEFHGSTNSGSNFVSFSFRKSKRFFDIQTWTGNGTLGRQISHSLNCDVGMVIVKRTDHSASWMVWHKKLFSPTAGALYFDANNAEVSGSNYWNNTAPTSTTLTLGNHWNTNYNGGTYVAYFFAHDTDDGNIIQCGDFQLSNVGINGVGGVLGTEHNLGWQPQFLMYRKLGSSSNWYVLDTLRGWGSAPIAYNSRSISPNLSDSENNVDNGAFVQTKGFHVSNASYFPHGSVNDTFVYLAIRKSPMKEPTSGSAVYASDYRYNGGAQGLHPKHDAYSGFPVDWELEASMTSDGHDMRARLFGEGNWYVGGQSNPSDTINLTSGGAGHFATTKGIKPFGSNGTLDTDIIYHMMRCYPKVFDMGAYCNVINSGTSMNVLGTAGGWLATGESGSGFTQVRHNLQAIPEIIMVRHHFTNTSGIASDAVIFHKDQISIYDGGTDGKYEGRWNVAEQQGNQGFDIITANSLTDEVFTVSGSSQLLDQSSNGSQSSFYNYWMWASFDGISKVGSFTGDTSNGVTVNCGFQPRFILMRITNPTTAGNSSWKLWSSHLGMGVGNDKWADMAGGARNHSADVFSLSSSGFSMLATSSYPSVHETGKRHCFLAIA